MIQLTAAFMNTVAAVSVAGQALTSIASLLFALNQAGEYGEDFVADIETLLKNTKHRRGKGHTCTLRNHGRACRGVSAG